MKTPQEAIMEQFKVIDDAVRDLKEMIEKKETYVMGIDYGFGEDWFKTWPTTSSTPENTDGEGGFINPNQL
jgi:hypothetical protein